MGRRFRERRQQRMEEMAPRDGGSSQGADSLLQMLMEPGGGLTGEEYVRWLEENGYSLRDVLMDNMESSSAARERRLRAPPGVRGPSETSGGAGAPMPLGMDVLDPWSRNGGRR